MNEPLIKVEIQKQSVELLKIYEECFEKKFSAKFATSPTNSEQTLMKDLIRMVGFKRMGELIPAYFRMGGTYEDKCYSLQELKYNINSINVRAPKKSEFKGKQLVQMEIYCDHCGKKETQNFEMDKICGYSFVCGACRATGIESKKEEIII